jgi:hypothetical protein
MKLKSNDLWRFAQLTTKASYNEELKDEFRWLGRRILNYIAQEMGLEKGTYEIRWNPGGIACSGDHTLHTERAYLDLSDNTGSGWFFYRTCKGRKDYGGGQNQIVTWERFIAPGGIEKLIAALKIIQAGGYKEEDGDFNMSPAAILRVTTALTGER